MTKRTQNDGFISGNLITTPYNKQHKSRTVYTMSTYVFYKSVPDNSKNNS